jgi:LytS/YehU family sensor histidine kinase
MAENLALTVELKVKLAVTAVLALAYVVGVIGLSYALGAATTPWIGWAVVIIAVAVPGVWLGEKVNDEIANTRARAAGVVKGEGYNGPAHSDIHTP